MPFEMLTEPMTWQAAHAIANRCTSLTQLHMAGCQRVRGRTYMYVYIYIHLYISIPIYLSIYLSIGCERVRGPVPCWGQ